MTFINRLLWIGLAILALLIYISNMGFRSIAEAYKISTPLSTTLGILLLGLTLLIFVLGARKTDILSQNKPIFQKGDGKRIGLGFLSIICVSIIGSILLQVLNGDKTTSNQAYLTEMLQNGNIVVMVLTVVFLAPIAEEIIFRGIIPLKIFKGYESWGYIIGGLLFALFHGPTNIMSFVIYGGASVILTLLACRTRRLEVSIAVHMINNGLPAILMLLIPILGVEV